MGVFLLLLTYYYAALNSTSSPSEATIGCASRKVSSMDRKENIGRPFPACSAYVVNSKLEILPLGVAGELVIEGPLVAMGYHRLPEVTAKSFKEWPTKGCWAYRTGDLGMTATFTTGCPVPIYLTVRMTAEGNLLIHGRIDSQIKLRGVRIESEGVSEIVRKAAKRKTSAHTCITSHPDLGNQILVCFFANDNPSVDIHQKRTSSPKILSDRSGDLFQIRSAVEAELAVYMRPSHIIPLDFLPLTLNGKIDGSKLSSVFQQTPIDQLMKLQHSRSPSLAAQTSRESTDIEEKILTIVSRISGLPRSQLSPSSNLFECGFDSLRFSSLTRELRGAFPASALSVSTVLQSPVIEAIATLCSGVDGESPSEKVADYAWLEEFSRKHRPFARRIFRDGDMERILPTLPIQDGILAQSMQFKNLYVQHFLYRLKAGADLDRLENAWRMVAQRQEILRYVVSFLLSSRQPVAHFLEVLHSLSGRRHYKSFYFPTRHRYLGPSTILRKVATSPNGSKSKKGPGLRKKLMMTSRHRCSDSTYTGLPALPTSPSRSTTPYTTVLRFLCS